MPAIAPKMLDYIGNFNFMYVNEVSSCYEKLLKIGQGTFGEVFKARCRRSGKLVALKKILMENEKEGFPITALREIKMLQKLKHPNITELIDICSEKSQRQRFSFYLVFTFCDHDLAGLLSHPTLKVKLVEIKTMIKHILNGLYKIHASNILHRDMKAANVLISNEGVLKLADFGLARPTYRDSSTAIYTNRVVTLWYRPPELLLGTRNYGPAIDIWGAGCIMAELWIRSPILQGESEAHQLQLISNLCGSINPSTWTDVDKLPYYSKMELPQNLPRRLRERVRTYLHYNDQALSVLDVMLTLNPALRPSAEQLLDHSFFYEPPRPLENIRELLAQLKTNMFEYTAGCGAHANRGRAAAQQQQQLQMQQQQQQQQQMNSQHHHMAAGTSRGGIHNSNSSHPPPSSSQQQQAVHPHQQHRPFASGASGMGPPNHHHVNSNNSAMMQQQPPYQHAHRHLQQQPPQRPHPYQRPSVAYHRETQR